MSGITLPAEFGFVGASIVATGYLTLWQTIKVSRARKQANIKYPQLYAEKAEAAASADVMKFNCVQRAHQHTLELLPNVIFNTAFLGLFYPRIASTACLVWTLGTAVYTIGYSSGNPDNRRGALPMIGEMGYMALILGSTWSAGMAVFALLQ